MPIRIAVLGGRRALLECARDLGLDVVYFQQPGEYDEDTAALAGQIVSVNLGNYPELLEAVSRCHAERPFTRAFSITEGELVSTARINAELGLGGNSVHSVELLKDKWRMRQLLATKGLSPIRARTVRDPEETIAFLREVGRRIVLKPVNGEASKDVHLLDTVAEVRAAWQMLGGRRMLVEEYLRGREISVETFSAGGRHTVIGCTDKTLSPGLVEIGHTMPGALPCDLAATVVALVKDFLDVIGLYEGPSHTELILTKDGPRIIESQNRIGGGSHRELIRLAYGVDMARLALSVPLGLEPAPQEPVGPLGGAAVRFFTPEPGIIERIDGVDAFDGDSNVSIQFTSSPGDTVPPLRSSYDRTTGFVIGCGPGPAQAVEACERVLSAVQVVTSRR